MVWFTAGLACAATGSPYVGAAACGKCHAAEQKKWAGSRHSKMVQPATRASVKGDFLRGQVTLRGANYRLREKDGVYYISESYLTGKVQEHRVDYTLGNRRIQHYLTTLASGRVVVLPPSWDVIRKQWFHSFDIDDPDETDDVMVQVWNKNCYSCHVSQQEKNYDSAKDEYKSAWLDFGTNCERCHGPGAEHVAHYSAASKPAGPVSDIVLQTKLSPERNTMVCAQCHSFRDIYVRGYSAGADYYDYFVPILESTQPADKDPAYWADGRTRRFSNDAFGLWQSECYLKGRATCVDCHVSAHETEIERNPQLRPDANALCARCHQSVAPHSHHAANSTGNSCVECHMPRTVFSIKAAIRDHSMSIPVPENTINHEVPNACNACHQDKAADWALARMKEWYGDQSRQKLIRRADAFALARKGDRAALPKLLEILGKASEGPLVRGNAVNYLSQFAEAGPALEQAAADSDSLVRALAVLRVRNRDVLVRALGDPIATVRLGAAVSLVGMGVKELPGEDGVRFEAAKAVYRARAEFNSDDAGQQLGAGKFYLLAGDPVTAVKSLESSLKLDPEVQAQFYLGYAYAQQGEWAKARTVLGGIKAADPQYERAQALLRNISGR